MFSLYILSLSIFCIYLLPNTNYCRFRIVKKTHLVYMYLVVGSIVDSMKTPGLYTHGYPCISLSNLFLLLLNVANSSIYTSL